MSPLYFHQNLQKLELDKQEYEKFSKPLSGITFSLPAVAEFAAEQDNEWFAGARKVQALGSSGSGGSGGAQLALTDKKEGTPEARVATDPANDDDYTKMAKMVGAFT